MLTKKQIANIVKRASFINEMVKKNIPSKVFQIANKKETIVIDDEIRTVLAIEDEIVKNEPSQWLRHVFAGIKAGQKDIYILSGNPLARTKFYEVKREFVNRIYSCCIYKGLVSYEDILSGSPYWFEALAIGMDTLKIYSQFIPAANVLSLTWYLWSKSFNVLDVWIAFSPKWTAWLLFYWNVFTYDCHIVAVWSEFDLGAVTAWLMLE